MARRGLVVLLLVLVVVVGSPTPASAHTGQVAATDYRARITRANGLDVRLDLIDGVWRPVHALGAANADLRNAEARS